MPRRKQGPLTSCKHGGRCAGWSIRYKCAFCAVEHQDKGRAKARAKKIRRAPLEQQRAMLRNMSVKERAAWRRRQKIALAGRALKNDDAMVTGNSLLSLPPEIRDEIYGHLFEETGRIHITASYYRIGSPQSDTYRLRQVCRLQRNEVESYIYKTRSITFATRHGMAAWTKKWPGRLSVMRTAISNFNCVSTLPTASAYLHNLRVLVIHQWSENCYSHPSKDIYSERYNSTRVSLETLLAWRLPEAIARALPRFDQGIVQHAKARILRFLMLNRHEQRQGHGHGPGHGWMTSVNPLKHDGRPIWTDIDLSLLAPRIDKAVAQIRASHAKPDYPCCTVQQYRSFEDFVERGLGRKRIVSKASSEKSVKSRVEAVKHRRVSPG